MEYITGTSLFFYMVALAGWWNKPTFSPIGVLSAFYDGNLSVSNASDWTREFVDSYWLPVKSINA